MCVSVYICVCVLIPSIIFSICTPLANMVFTLVVMLLGNGRYLHSLYPVGDLFVLLCNKPLTFPDIKSLLAVIVAKQNFSGGSLRDSFDDLFLSVFHCLLQPLYPPSRQQV